MRAISTAPIIVEKIAKNGFNLDRCDRELRRPFPSEPRFATESKVWWLEHAIADPAKPAASVHEKATTATGQWLESQ
jgi:hypothetical protein